MAAGVTVEPIRTDVGPANSPSGAEEQGADTGGRLADSVSSALVRCKFRDGQGETALTALEVAAGSTMSQQSPASFLTLDEPQLLHGVTESVSIGCAQLRHTERARRGRQARERERGKRPRKAKRDDRLRRTEMGLSEEGPWSGDCPCKLPSSPRAERKREHSVAGHQVIGTRLRPGNEVNSQQRNLEELHY